MRAKRTTSPIRRASRIALRLVGSAFLLVVVASHLAEKSQWLAWMGWAFPKSGSLCRSCQRDPWGESFRWRIAASPVFGAQNLGPSVAAAVANAVLLTS